MSLVKVNNIKKYIHAHRMVKLKNNFMLMKNKWLWGHYSTVYPYYLENDRIDKISNIALDLYFLTLFQVTIKSQKKLETLSLLCVSLTNCVGQGIYL